MKPLPRRRVVRAVVAHPHEAIHRCVGRLRADHLMSGAAYQADCLQLFAPDGAG